MEKANRIAKSAFREKQLSSLYWPLYLRLMKDDAMWRLLPQLSNGPNLLPEELARKIEIEFLIRNHVEAVSIIESNIHLVQGDLLMLKDLVAYIRHVAVYKAVRDAGRYDLNPLDLNQPFPHDMIKRVKTHLDLIQAEYDALITTNAAGYGKSE